MFDYQVHYRITEYQGLEGTRAEWMIQQQPVTNITWIQIPVQLVSLSI